jgi:ATP-dependent Clp protease protease subunit
MIHQPLGGIGGQATDIEIEADEMLKARDRLNQTIADRTGQTVERVEKDTDRNFWMSPEEALEYGIVGRIVKSISDV